MLINIFAGIVTLFYIMNVPVVAKISLSRTGVIDIRVGVFSANLGIKFNTSVKSLISGAFKKKQRPKPASGRAIFKLIEFRRAGARVSMPDAYYTALVSGAAIGVLSAIGFKEVRVTPDFSSRESAVDLACIISLSVGKAFIASGNIALGVIKERIKKWNSAVK